MKLDVDWLETRARIDPEKIAIIDGDTGEQWTYEQVNLMIGALTEQFIERGIRFGERVLLLSNNNIRGFLLLFACRRIGAIFVPMNGRLHVKELNMLVEDCTPKYLVYDETHEHLAEQLHIQDKGMVDLACLQGPSNINTSYTYEWSSPWMMIYTGGTTGKPKGVVLSNRSIHTNAINTLTSWGLSSSDTTITVLPMFHTGGIKL
ncbi:class I adenylate-forming enzyme family protein [Geomicrobium sp. JCM 19039]|uniref:AMP-binding protein n=1 Tax=Geomicrobium sp. JCM 19039 TaxID=1460636 RepID=UPI00045F1F47|nr:class I adenylate-forming enzyme family protein [Geomicrobium sp. JCM 19039]GAK13287.1 long-chain-fatty-acid-CoA ligase [Geomicrobium sp. JCM 19039]